MLMLIECVCIFSYLVGFLYIFLAIEDVVPSSEVLLCVMYFLSQFGVSCHISSAVTMSVKLFPRESRGVAVGLVKGYFAMSTAVLGDIYSGFFSEAQAEFILFIATAIPVLSTFC